MVTQNCVKSFPDAPTHSKVRDEVISIQITYMLIVALLVSCFVSVERAWKASLLCLAISIELLLCMRVFEATSSYMPHLGSLLLTVILEAGLLTAGFLVGRGLRWIFVRERPLPKMISMASEWRDSSLIKPLFYLCLTALGMTSFAVICLDTPEGSRWEISYSSISWPIACLGVLLTWMIAFRRLAKGRLFIGTASVLVGILLKGFSLLLQGNYVSAVAASATTGVVQITAANQKPVGSTGATGATGPQGAGGLITRDTFLCQGVCRRVCRHVMVPRLLTATGRQ
jgi:hypothetical protein